MQSIDAVEAGRRAQVILMPLMLRRTKDAKLEGQPILNLPPKHIDLVTFPFSRDERTVSSLDTFFCDADRMVVFLGLIALRRIREAK
jgi:SNF2 family DNA or RNA helicase